MVMVRVLQNSNRRDGENSRSQRTPPKDRPAKPSLIKTNMHRTCGSGDGDNFRRRQCVRNYISAIAAARKMLHHEEAFAAGKRLLGERSEKIRIGMRFSGWCDLPQPLEHEFWDVLHFSF